jgi:hypothetical protein
MYMETIRKDEVLEEDGMEANTTTEIVIFNSFLPV